jgi:hypothetical protein
VAKERWSDIVPLLVANKLLTEVDLGPLERYCELCADYRELQDLGVETIHARIKLSTEMARFERSYGLTPGSRGSVQPAKAPDVTGDGEGKAARKRKLLNGS